METDGWLGIGYDSTTFVGQMNHHTAISGPCMLSTAAAMLRGRPDLPGPLCNGHGGLDTEGRFVLYMVAGRRARHAGPGSATVLAEVTRDIAPSGDAGGRGLADDSSVGNRSFFGWEWQHPGDGSLWPPALLEGVGRCNAALADLAGWTANRSIHHREWTRRKIDMSWRGDLRALVAKHLEDDMALSDDDKAWIAKTIETQVREELMAYGRYLFADVGGSVYADNRLGLTATQGPPVTIPDLVKKIAALQPGVSATGDLVGTVKVTLSPSQ